MPDRTCSASHHNNGAINDGDFFHRVSDNLLRSVLSFLDGRDLARSREVCRRWDAVCDDSLWRSLALRKCRALASDDAAWSLFDDGVDVGATQSDKWRRIYPAILASPRCAVRLQKVDSFICNILAHQVRPRVALDEGGLPEVLVMERRFRLAHLNTFILPNAALMYLEPQNDEDQPAFEEFTQYLQRIARAGLAMQGDRRFILLPPCEYTKTEVGYTGESLLGIVQYAYPPLAQQ